MVGETDWHTETVAKVLQRFQVELVELRRIRGDAMQQDDLFVRMRMHPVNRLLDFLDGAHSGGKQDRFTLAADMLDQWPVSNVTRCDLESTHAKLIEKVGAFFIKRCGQKLDAYPLRFLMQNAECV